MAAEMVLPVHTEVGALGKGHGNVCHHCYELAAVVIVAGALGLNTEHPGLSSGSIVSGCLTVCRQLT